jgi:type IV pilus assembly protein PilV
MRGFTMVEVLVTIVIICLGLLGLAQLHVRIQQSELEAYQRAQALTLLSDMVSRINANRQTAPCYAITGTAGTPYLGAAGSDHLDAPTCMGYGYASTQARAVSDMTAWDGFLNGTSETQSGAAVGAMIGARGCVSFDAVTNTYTVAIAWQGIADMPASTVNCANNLYGSETKRRVVWTTLTIGTLL